jgi:hypothetical protein
MSLLRTPALYQSKGYSQPRNLKYIINKILFKKVVIDGENKMVPAMDNETGPNVKECTLMDITGVELFIPAISYVKRLSIYTLLGRLRDCYDLG